MSPRDGGASAVSSLQPTAFNEQQINCGILNFMGKLMLCCYSDQKD